MFELAAVLLSAITLGASAPAPAPAAAPAASGVCRDGRTWTTSATDQHEMLGMVNVARQQFKRRPVTRLSVLDRMAQAHAVDMACRNYFSHHNPERQKLPARLRRVAGSDEPEWERLAEVLGTSATAFRQVQGWIDSRSHRLALLDRDHDRVGVGLVRIAEGSRYHTYWAVEFITETEAGARRTEANLRAEAARPQPQAPTAIASAPAPDAAAPSTAAAAPASEPARRGKPKPTPRVFPQPRGR